MRVQRAIARAGIASRRTADALVDAGRVRVNGVVAVLGQVVNPATDNIEVDGALVPPPAATQWFVLHKPSGVMTTAKDPKGRKTVFALVPSVPGLTYVGRLDLLTEGVLLLTNDGTAAHRLTHPSGGIEREYEVTVRGDVESALPRLRKGVTLEDGPARALRVAGESLGRGRWTLTLVLGEGRNREVRRLCEAVHLAVERLVRVRYGPVKLGDLPAGAWRAVSPKEAVELGIAVPTPRRSSRLRRG